MDTTSPTAIGEIFLGHLVAGRFDRLPDTLEPDVTLNAAIPDGMFEWHGIERFCRAFTRWFGDLDMYEVVDAALGEFGPRLQMFWRARVRGGRFGDDVHVVEQYTYADLGPTGRIQTMYLLCSGFCRVHGEA